MTRWMMFVFLGMVFIATGLWISSIMSEEIAATVLSATE